MIKHLFARMRNIKEKNSDLYTVCNVIRSFTDMIVYYAMTYMILYCIDKKSFIFNVSPTSPLDIFVDFLYFSTVTFTTLGYGDISPLSNIAKVIVIFEILTFVLGITTIIGMTQNKNEIRK